MEFPLGRKVQHDVRSFKFAAPALQPVRTKLWRRYGAILDQGDLGSCTGNAAAHAANSLPLHTTGGKILLESDAVSLYKRATELDNVEGTYPPDDTGSSGLAVAKAGVEKGIWTRYEWAFGFDHALSSLMEGPLLIGTNWYYDMFYPNVNGFVTPTGENVGGHEYLLTGVSVVGKYVTCTNSWSNLWGLNGRFRIRFADFQRLLSEDGDAILLRK
jgi:hypothetical protein